MQISLVIIITRKRKLDFRKTVVPRENGLITPKKIATKINYQNTSYDKRIYSENRYKGLQNSRICN